MRTRIVCAAAALCVGCGTEVPVEGGHRLSFVNYGSDGGSYYFDTQRKEVCRPYMSDGFGARCMPRFTRIEPQQLGYASRYCNDSVAWTALEQPTDRYVAYVNDDVAGLPFVYSIYGVLGITSDTARGEPINYRLTTEGCAPESVQSGREFVYITRAIHPEEFAHVRNE
jgi:hypothetical protein